MSGQKEMIVSHGGEGMTGASYQSSKSTKIAAANPPYPLKELPQVRDELCTYNFTSGMESCQ